MGNNDVLVKIKTIVVGILFAALFAFSEHDTSLFHVKTFINALIGFSFGCSAVVGVTSYMKSKEAREKILKNG